MKNELFYAFDKTTEIIVEATTEVGLFKAMHNVTEPDSQWVICTREELAQML